MFITIALFVVVFATIATVTFDTASTLERHTRRYTTRGRRPFTSFQAVSVTSGCFGKQF